MGAPSSSSRTSTASSSRRAERIRGTRPATRIGTGRGRFQGLGPRLAPPHPSRSSLSRRRDARGRDCLTLSMRVADDDTAPRYPRRSGVDHGRRARSRARLPSSDQATTRGRRPLVDLVRPRPRRPRATHRILSTRRGDPFEVRALLLEATFRSDWIAVPQDPESKRWARGTIDRGAADGLLVGMMMYALDEKGGYEGLVETVEEGQAHLVFIGRPNGRIPKTGGRFSTVPRPAPERPGPVPPRER
jgi:hypothetical protein